MKYLIIIFIGALSVFSSCFNSNEVSTELDLQYKLLDSIKIESNNTIRFLSVDKENEQYLFLEENTNTLILYDHINEKQSNLEQLKVKYPEFSDQILAGHLSNNDLNIFTTGSLLKYSIENDSILFYNSGVVARKFTPGIKMVKIKDNILSNMAFYESLSRDQFMRFSYSILDTIGNLTPILANPYFENYPPDIRIYNDFDLENDTYITYAFPYNKLYTGKFDSFGKLSKLEEHEINIDFLKDHPYYHGLNYGIQDFRYIPVVYDFEMSSELIILNLNEGGNRDTGEYDGKRYLVMYDISGEYIGRFQLEKELLATEAEIDNSIFLFSSNPEVELPNHTIFKIVKLEFSEK